MFFTGAIVFEHPSISTQSLKRRRDIPAQQDDPDPYDIDGGAQGAKHWTDDEKSKLFSLE